MGFSELLVSIDLPPSDPAFKQGLEGIHAVFEECEKMPAGALRDPVCGNGPYAVHSVEGTAVYLGDVYAKTQDRSAALAAYELAKASPDWERWPYRELLEERVRTLDARIAAAASESTSDDLEAAWASPIQCSLCHQDAPATQ